MKLLNIVKKNIALSLLVGSVLLGAGLRVINLSDARFRFPDEYSSINYYYKYPFLRIVYKPIMSLLGSPYSQEAALYTSAFFGVLTLLVVFAIGKDLFNETVGGYSAAVLAVSGYHTYFSRIAYAATLQTFFLLIGGWLLILAFKENKSKTGYLLAAGFVFGCAFTTYAVSYVSIFVFYLLLVLIQRYRQIDIKRILITIITLSAGIAIPILFIEFYSQFFYGRSYLSVLMIYQKDTAQYAPKDLRAPLLLFNRISDLGGSWQLLLASAGFLYILISGLWKKNGNLLLLAGFISGCYLLFSGMALLGVHSLAPRKYLFLIPFVCLGSGYLFYGLEKMIPQYWVLLLLAVFVGVSFSKCMAITEDTFKIKPMTAWLKQQGIGKSQITTRLDLAEKGDMEETYPLPIKYNEAKYQGLVIRWEIVKKFYRKRGVRYLITSGLGTTAQIGTIDPVFRKKIKPLKTWTLPGRPGTFSLYYLKDLLAAMDTG